MTAWQTEAEKFITAPAVLCDLYLDNETLRWATDWIRPELSAPYTGKIISLPRITNSLGTVTRTYQYGEAQIELADPDRTLRGLAQVGGLKNRRLTIRVAFAGVDLADALTIFDGEVYTYKLLGGLGFQITAQQTALNFLTTYPDKTIVITDYPNAYSGILDQVIPVIWGTVSSTSGPCRTYMVDTTVDAEKHLVGLQQGATLGVTNVRLNGALKTVTTHYTITSQTIDGKVHTIISWVAGVRPTSSDLVTCNVAFVGGGAPVGPVACVKFFMDNWAGYINANFDATSYSDAVAEETSRAYVMNGCMASAKTLSEWLDQIRNEFELDIWRDSNTGLIMFQYLGESLSVSGTTHYRDYRDILGYTPNLMNIDFLVNWIRPAYNYDYAVQNFKNYSFYEDQNSQTRNGGTYKLTPTLYFIRDAASAYELAARKIFRMGDPRAFETFVFPIKAFSFPLGTILQITHFDGMGLQGYVGEYFQLRQMEFDLNSFILYATMENVTNFFLSGLLLGDETTYPTWPPVDLTQEIYAYLCDETTGKFANGDDGKELLDE